MESLRYSIYRRVFTFLLPFAQRQEQKRSDLDEQLKEYIAEWRKQRAKEEEELKRLKVRVRVNLSRILSLVASFSVFFFFF